MRRWSFGTAVAMGVGIICALAFAWFLPSPLVPVPSTPAVSPLPAAALEEVKFGAWVDGFRFGQLRYLCAEAWQPIYAIASAHTTTANTQWQFLLRQGFARRVLTCDALAQLVTEAQRLGSMQEVF